MHACDSVGGNAHFCSFWANGSYRVQAVFKAGEAWSAPEGLKPNLTLHFPGVRFHLV